MSAVFVLKQNLNRNIWEAATLHPYSSSYCSYKSILSKKNQCQSQKYRVAMVTGPLPLQHKHSREERGEFCFNSSIFSKKHHP